MIPRRTFSVLWILGWSAGYGAEYQDGAMTSEGRVFRMASKNSPAARWQTAKCSKARETWAAWTLGRLTPQDRTIDEGFSARAEDSAASLNLRVKALRNLTHRVCQTDGGRELPASVVNARRSAEPRLRFEAVEAIGQVRQRSAVPALLDLLAAEKDPTTFYAAWQTLRGSQNAAPAKAQQNTAAVTPGASVASKAWPTGDGFRFVESADRLVIAHSGQPVAEFVFRDDAILRPYFANVHAPGGLKATRNHPPIAGVDATDHDTMHPGVWLAFGDISGADFWRNKGRIEHVRFTEPPAVRDGRLTFATECRLRTAEGRTLCALTNRFALAAQTNAWLLAWDATFRSDEGDLTFGDQEEMGFGARVATAITEKNGGVITSSAGLKTAKNTWGQSAEWCDYSGTVDGHRIGITLLADPANFRPSWWHNRDYGVFVANPFGRKAMKQGAASAVTVQRGENFRLRFGAVIHAGSEFNPPGACREYLDSLPGKPGE